MNQLSFIVSVAVVFISSACYAQNEIDIVKRKNPSKHRTLYFDKKFEIKVGEDNYNAKIIDVSGTHISILQQNLKKSASPVSDDKHPYNWAYDTLKIPIQQIDYIKSHRYKNRRWVIPFASVAALTIGTVFFTPLVSAIKGRKTADKMALIQIGILAVTLPPILIGTRKVKYDLKTKWKFNL